MKSYIYLFSLLAFCALSVSADIDQILEVNDNNIILSESSQEKVDNLADEKDSLLAEWKVVVKQVEGLKRKLPNLNVQIIMQAAITRVLMSRPPVC